MQTPRPSIVHDQRAFRSASSISLPPISEIVNAQRLSAPQGSQPAEQLQQPPQQPVEKIVFQTPNYSSSVAPITSAGKSSTNSSVSSASSASSSLTNNDAKKNTLPVSSLPSPPANSYVPYVAVPNAQGQTAFYQPVTPQSPLDAFSPYATATPGGTEIVDPKRKEIKKRTRTGCMTCRKRRIKCDERKPVCGNCIKSKRECSGYVDIPVQRNKVAKPAPKITTRQLAIKPNTEILPK